ncbi:MAG: hypothetical protein QOC97_650, partial [Chloroflexota bacterium]|nr:hypothetical protein [Chloroflexota bacterium]
WRRDRRALAVLAAFAVSYLVGVSASPLHWDRYVIPLVPIIGIAAAAGVLAIGDLAVRAVSRRRAGRREAAASLAPTRTPVAGGLPAIGVSGAIVIALLLPPMATVVATDRIRAQATTRAVATDWIVANLPPGSRIVEENGSAYTVAGFDVLRVFSLSDRSLDAYRAGGYRYLVWSSGMADRFQDAVAYPREHAFYAALEATGRLVASFQPGPEHGGNWTRVYQIMP